MRPPAARTRFTSSSGGRDRPGCATPDASDRPPHGPPRVRATRRRARRTASVVPAGRPPRSEPRRDGDGVLMLAEHRLDALRRHGEPCDAGPDGRRQRPRLRTATRFARMRITCSAASAGSWPGGADLLGAPAGLDARAARASGRRARRGGGREGAARSRPARAGRGASRTAPIRGHRSTSAAASASRPSAARNGSADEASHRRQRLQPVVDPGAQHVHLADASRARARATGARGATTSPTPNRGHRRTCAGPSAACGWRPASGGPPRGPGPRPRRARRERAVGSTPRGRPGRPPRPSAVVDHDDVGGGRGRARRHERARSSASRRNYDVRLGPRLRLRLRPAVAAELPREHVVAGVTSKISSRRAFSAGSRTSVHALHPVVEVARHEVRGPDEVPRLLARAEPEDPRVLEVAADDRTHADPLRQPGDPRPQAADAADDEFDLRAPAATPRRARRSSPGRPASSSSS